MAPKVSYTFFLDNFKCECYMVSNDYVDRKLIIKNSNSLFSVWQLQYNGCVDGFSRRIIWLEVQRSNKNPRLVAKYFLKCVIGARGCPTRVYTENGLIADIQCYLRAEGLDEHAGSKSHKYVSSTRNQRMSMVPLQETAFKLVDLFHNLHVQKKPPHVPAAQQV